MSVNATSSDREFYHLGLRQFNRAQKNGYEPQPPRGARGSRNAQWLLAHGWVRGRKAAVGFIRAQFWIHASVSDLCDTTGAVYETRNARRTGVWENGDVFQRNGIVLVTGAAQ